MRFGMLPVINLEVLPLIDVELLPIMALDLFENQELRTSTDTKVCSLCPYLARLFQCVGLVVTSLLQHLFVRINHVRDQVRGPVAIVVQALAERQHRRVVLKLAIHQHPVNTSIVPVF